MTISVTLDLTETAQDPIRALLKQLRASQTALPLVESDRRIDAGADRPEQRERQVETAIRALGTGHKSPFYAVNFVFNLSGVSRSFSHQFVRHHQGVAIQQQSQRYVTFRELFPYVTPPSIAGGPYEHEYRNLMTHIACFYERAIDGGVPGEDARFVLPNATETQLKVTMNFIALQQMADIRLCTRTQWEFRKVVARMRAAVVREWPLFGPYLAPKCAATRLGFCDERLEHYVACPLAAKRPHRSQLAAFGELDEADFDTLEQIA